jgi:bacillithiol system protein YtxJ
MHWIHLNEENQLKQIVAKSQNQPQVIFKHSLRCSISNVALNRMQSLKCVPQTDFYFLDVLAHREISNQVEQLFCVQHESPQIMVIVNGETVFHESHLNISADEVLAQTTMSKAS